ncbi:protein N-terminal asparagine amidohydrolase [Scleropages formosus]|uniref:N-terminal asparagine amidase n=1 Tax=Scleropages formosus TaxID=113540 RepID=A0A8C9V398_SCLFO|nr:protein N-terminal asparagine amidohydrolase [Scleropages formosus]
MPIFSQNRRIERLSATESFFARHPHLRDSAREFRAKGSVNVEPQCLLYVQQRECAATTPADKSVGVLGSDDATTCHLVVLRHTGSGATCLAHCDGSSTWSEVSLIVKAVNDLSRDANEGRLELHLIGGFDDDRKLSQQLSLNLLAAFQKQKEDIHLVTCCITELNDVVIDGVHRPIVYGIGVNVKTGDVFPASFPCREPAEDLRSARTFTGGQMIEIYDSSKEIVKISPCNWSPSSDFAFWLAQDDDTILQFLSTSPLAEPPHFVKHIKSTIKFLLEHPSADSLFPGGQPQLFHRTEKGDWEKVAQR